MLMIVIDNRINVDLKSFYETKIFITLCERTDKTVMQVLF